MDLPLTLQEGVPLGVDEPLLHLRVCGQPKKVFKKNGRTYHHQLAAAIMIQQKPLRTQLRRHSLRRERWAWWKAPSPPPSKKRPKSRPSELCPGPMAAIDEGDKIRTIYDGSFGGANAHIQKNSKEKTTAPQSIHGVYWLRAAGETSDESATAIGHEATASGVERGSKGSVWHWPKKDSTFFLLKADVSKAHRRIKILKPGWKYQVAQIDQLWWVNKVGTYGVASAQLYWGRLAALLLRILYALFLEVDWGYVFVDDFCWILRSTNAAWLTPAVLGVLLALGTPLSWKKTVLSEINTWLGFVINPSGPFVQMAKDKHVALLLKELQEGKVFFCKGIEKALGRIQWATATCPMAKPLLQPFWAWKSVVKTAG